MKTVKNNADGLFQFSGETTSAYNRCIGRYGINKKRQSRRNQVLTDTIGAASQLSP